MMLASLQSAFAEPNERLEGIRIELSIAKDAESKKIMEQSGIDELRHSLFVKEAGRKTIRNKTGVADSFTIEINNIIEGKKDYILITGQGEIILDSCVLPFMFQNQTLNKKEYNEKNEILTGVIKSTIMLGKEEKEINIDFCTVSNFSKSIASVSFGTLEEQDIVLFFGEIFDEYEEYYQKLFSGTSKDDDGIEDSHVASYANVKGDNSYAQMGIVTGRGFNNSSSGSETIVMSVAKRDYRDRNSKERGFELVRAFGRSDNALNYVSGATSAYPVAVDFTFKCSKKDFLDVEEVTPDGNGDEMPGIFNIFATLHPSVGTLIAAVDLLYKTVSRETTANIYAESGFSDENAANGTVAISGLNNMANANLPATVLATDAKSDMRHGVTWKIKYGTTGNDTATVASVTVTAKMDYRFYYDTHRSTVKTTNEISKTHWVYKS